MEHMSEIFEDIRRQEIVPIETGIPYLNETIGGYYPGEMTTICGEQCCCKTAFVIHQLCHIAIDNKIPTLLVLNYMSARNFISSMIAYYYSIESKNIHNILDSDKYKDVLEDFSQKLKESPLHLIKCNWYEKESIIDRIDNFVESKNIGIIFLDEVILDLTLEDTKGRISSIKSIAISRNIPVIVACNVWNDREGVEYVRPLLSDVNRNSCLNGHDIVIGFANYEKHGIFMDDLGRDLHGLICVEILKYRGKLQKKTHYIPKEFFFFRDYGKRQ